MRQMYISIISSFVFACLSYSQTEQSEISEGNLKDKDLVSGEHYYLTNYKEFLESANILNMVNKSMSDNNLKFNDNQKLYYISGYIRGLIENATLQGLKNSNHTAKIHFVPLGENVRIERLGWIEGCKEGNTKGNDILNLYKSYLKK